MRIHIMKFTFYMFTNEFYIGCHNTIMWKLHCYVIFTFSYCQSHQFSALCDLDKRLPFFLSDRLGEDVLSLLGTTEKPNGVLLASAEKVRKDVCQCFSPYYTVGTEIVTNAASKVLQSPCICHTIQIQGRCLSHRDNLTFVNLTQQHLKWWSNVRCSLSVHYAEKTSNAPKVV